MVAIETERPITADAAREILQAAPGIVVIDDPQNAEYPTVQISNNTDPVYVGRLRNDPSTSNGLLMWVVADNLRKGAATNAIQILELLNNRITE
jgi:aspartate-semialdehyde dehydrogenase